MLQLKENLVKDDLLILQPALYSLIGFYFAYAARYDLHSMITSMKSDHVKRISKTHSSGRAVDTSSRGWSEFHINNFVHECNIRFKDIAALSFSDKKPRACLHHKFNEGALHFHLQCKPQGE